MYKSEESKFRSAQRIRVGIGSKFPALSLDKAIREISERTRVEEYLLYYALNLGPRKIYLTEAQVIMVSNAVDLDPSLSVSIFEEEGRLESQKGRLTEILLRRNGMKPEKKTSEWWEKFKNLFAHPPKKETGAMIFKALRLKYGFVTRGQLAQKLLPKEPIEGITISFLENTIERLEQVRGPVNEFFVQASCSWFEMNPADRSDFIATYLAAFGLISRPRKGGLNHLSRKGDATLTHTQSKRRGVIKKMSDQDQISFIKGIDRVRHSFEMLDSGRTEFENNSEPERDYHVMMSKLLMLAHRGFLSDLSLREGLDLIEFQLERLGFKYKLGFKDLERSSEEGAEEGTEKGNVVALKPSRTEE